MFLEYRVLCRGGPDCGLGPRDQNVQKKGDKGPFDMEAVDESRMRCVLKMEKQGIYTGLAGQKIKPDAHSREKLNGRLAQSWDSGGLHSPYKVEYHRGTTATGNTINRMLSRRSESL
ncbi:potassium voltage-gated channel subfamily KQT member 4 isoform X3 [Prionailurus iriomotensis]